MSSLFVSSRTGRGHEEAIALHERWDATAAGIQADGRLSDAGKRDAMARAYVTYRNGLTTIQQQAGQRREQRAGELTRQAFAVPTDAVAAMSYRDALGRAEAIDDPRVAANKMVQSLETGDELMAKALARHAAVQGWGDVLGEYTQAVPETGRALSELQQLRDEATDPAVRMSDSMHFTARKPAELANYSDFAIDSMVAAASEVAQ